MTVRPCSLKAASNRWVGWGGGGCWTRVARQQIATEIQYNWIHTIRKLLFARTARKHKLDWLPASQELRRDSPEAHHSVQTWQTYTRADIVKTERCLTCLQNRGGTQREAKVQGSKCHGVTATQELRTDSQGLYRNDAALCEGTAPINPIPDPHLASGADIRSIPGSRPQGSVYVHIHSSCAGARARLGFDTATARRQRTGRAVQQDAETLWLSATLWSVACPPSAKPWKRHPPYSGTPSLAHGTAVGGAEVCWPQRTGGGRPKPPLTARNRP